MFDTLSGESAKAVQQPDRKVLMNFFDLKFGIWFHGSFIYKAVPWSTEQFLTLCNELGLQHKVCVIFIDSEENYSKRIFMRREDLVEVVEVGLSKHWHT